MFSLKFRKVTIQLEILDKFFTLFEQGNSVQDLRSGVCCFEMMTHPIPAPQTFQARAGRRSLQQN